MAAPLASQTSLSRGITTGPDSNNKQPDAYISELLSYSLERLRKVSHIPQQ
jgi:hypothetical protein